MPEDKRHLQWHGNQWRVRIKVPSKLVDTVGETVLIQPLYVTNLTAANLLKGEHVSRFKAQLSEARKILGISDPVESEALATRSHLQKIKAITKSSGNDSSEKHLGEEAGILERTEQLEKEHGQKRAKFYYDTAMGNLTALDHHLETYLSQTNYKGKSKGELERVLRWLKEWMKDNDLTPFIESIDKKIAGRFVDEFLLKGRSKKTASKSLSFIRGYWEWLKGRGIVGEENYWQGIIMGSRSSSKSRGSTRAYTESELADLLSKAEKEVLKDIMYIGVLSGMRLEEICKLKVNTCSSGYFIVEEGKTINSIRRIPIHSKLQKMVRSRMIDKAPTDYLIHEAGIVPPSRTEDNHRSDPLGKMFNRYRRDVCGIDERPNGQRRSNVTFHSFRNTFIQKAAHGLHQPSPMYSAWTIAKLVGHETEGVITALNLTMHGYAGADSDEALKACVEAVKLPKFTTKEKEQ